MFNSNDTPVIRAICMIGNHESEPLEIENGMLSNSLRGWRLLPASLDANDKWVYDANSMRSIHVCPKCILPGEPGVN